MFSLHIVKDDETHPESIFWHAPACPAPSHIGTLHLKSYQFHAPCAGNPARPVHLCTSTLAAAGTSHEEPLAGTSSHEQPLRACSACGTERLGEPTLPPAVCAPAPPQSFVVDSFRQPCSQPLTAVRPTVLRRIAALAGMFQGVSAPTARAGCWKSCGDGLHVSKSPNSEIDTAHALVHWLKKAESELILVFPQKFWDHGKARTCPARGRPAASRRREASVRRRRA